MLNNQEQFNCALCETSFKRKHHLKAHMTTHSTQSLNKCSICLKNYKRIQDLNRHKKLEHSTIDSVLVTPSFGMDSYSRSLFERNIMLERQVKMLEEELSIERAKLRRLTLNGGDFCNVDYDVLRSGIQY